MSWSNSEKVLIFLLLVFLFFFDSLDNKVQLSRYENILFDVWWHLGHEGPKDLDDYKVGSGSLMQAAEKNLLLYHFQGLECFGPTCGIQSNHGSNPQIVKNVHVHISQGGGEQCTFIPLSEIIGSGHLISTILREGECKDSCIKTATFEIVNENLSICLFPNSSPRQLHYIEFSSCRISFLVGEKETDFFIRIAIHLAEYPSVWPAKDNVPSEVTEQHRKLHDLYSDVLSFGNHQTVALIDAGWFNKDATNSVENKLNMCGFETIQPSGPKLVAAFDVVDYVRNTSFQGDYFGHGSAVWK
jgi:hypothetical protein